MSTVVATCNAPRTLRGAKLHQAVHAAIPAKIIGYQEIESRAHLNELEHIGVHDVAWPGGRYKTGKRKGQPRLNPRNATPIAYNRDTFAFHAVHATLAIPGIGHVSPSRYTTWAIFKRKHDGQMVGCVNIHTISALYKTAHYAKWKGKTRRAVWKIHMAQVRRRIRKIRKNHPGIKIIVMGDLNHPKRLTAKQLGVTPHYAKKPTHGRSWFDVIGTDCPVTRIRRRTGTPSDHDVLVAHIAL